MRQARTLLLAVALALPGAGHGMTLEEAFAAAVDRSPELRRQYARYQSMREMRNEARSNYYPQLGLRGAVGPEYTKYRSGQYVGENYTRDNLSLFVRQMLFNGFETPANSQRLSEEAEAERLQLKASAENLALQVCETYLDARQAQELVRLAEKHVQDHLSVLEDVKGLVRTGHASETDVAQASARLANARASLVSAQNDARDNDARFLRLVGASPAQLVDPVPDLALLPDSVDTAMQWARDNHPQLQSAAADVRAAAQEVRASRSGYFPRVSVEGSANRGHNIGGLEGREEDYRIMLVLEYDLFNGWRDVSRERASSWRHGEAKEIQRNAEDQLMEGTRFSWNAWKSLNEQEQIQRAAVDASTLSESGYITQFKLGRRSLLDLLNAKAEVFLARRNYLSAHYDRVQAAYRLFNATGRLGYGLRVPYPQEWEADAKAGDPDAARPAEATAGGVK
ncbi:TolC family outer membrane protein [Uliginosibacterium sp. H1]|uniref:TolC family outer membrane protein n=1 Tax=Uliginosibacterium sp. H1 TaxID=3114757 RepID=UPI002E198D86|nr:TolC family outer membrane protein [Uliginosibacterium sp. H1]